MYNSGFYFVSDLFLLLLGRRVYAQLLVQHAHAELLLEYLNASSLHDPCLCPTWASSDCLTCPL